MASTRTARRGASSSWRIRRGWSRMKNFGLRPCRRVTRWRIPITSQSRFPSFVTVKRSSLRCLSSWRRSCGRVGFDGSLTFINFQDICSAVTQSGMSCFGARSSQQFHQRGTLYICPHALQKPSQSLCACGLTSWGFIVKIGIFINIKLPSL